MTDQSDPNPDYAGTVGGAYSTEEHLKAQQVQKSASTGKPLHEQGNPGVYPDDDDTDTEPATPAESAEPVSDAGTHAAPPDAEGLGETPPAPIG